MLDTNALTRATHVLDLGNVVANLLADGLIAPADADALRERHPTPVHPLVVIAERNLISRRPPHKPLTLDTLTAWLAERCGLPYQHIDPLKIDVAAVTALVSYAYAAGNQILPLAITPTQVVVATADPYRRDWQRELRSLLRRPVVRVLANPLDLRRYLVEFYTLSRSVQQASRANANVQSGITNLEQLVELGRDGKLDANDQHVVTIVDWLLQYAFEQRASDIHLEPRREEGGVRFRIDGVLHLVYQMPVPVMAAVTSRLKILARMDVAERRRPLDGRLKTRTPSGKEVELRLSTLPTAFGEKLVMRIFDPDVLLKGYRELGFDSEDLARWNALCAHPHGIVLVTGPTGSGKTTTLYSTLRALATDAVNVCTIEDPIEMVEPRFNQMQVQPQIGLDFAGGVRALLRQDPDVIMIGEIRDRETADMAVQAALTGHLVLSTLHTNDAPSAITRLREMGVPAYLINATVLGVVAQRLLRRLCPHCKTAVAVDATQWQALAQVGEPIPPRSVFAPQGCLECRNTGYRGRVGIYETLTLTPALRALVQAEGDTAALRAQARKDGLRPLRVSGLHKVRAGVTTLDEVREAVSLEEG